MPLATNALPLTKRVLPLAKRVLPLPADVLPLKIYVISVYIGIHIRPLSLIRAAGGKYQREGGDPERFNGNSLAAMDGTGPMGNAIRLLFPRRGLPAFPAGIGRTGPWKKNAGGGEIPARPERRRFPIKRRHCIQGPPVPFQ